MMDSGVAWMLGEVDRRERERRLVASARMRELSQVVAAAARCCSESRIAGLLRALRTGRTAEASCCPA